MRNNICSYYADNHLKKKDMQSKKNKVYTYLLQNVFHQENFNNLSIKDVKATFKIIDEIYFYNEISKRIKLMGAKLEFDASNRLSCTAGFCEYKYKKILDEITNSYILIWNFKLTMSSKIITNLFKNNEKILKINGLKCKNRLECYINLFEHEIIHLLMIIYCFEKSKEYGGHNKTFVNIVYNLFGHTDYKHQLLCGDAEQNEQDTSKFKDILKIGDIIITKTIKGEKKEGEIINLTSKYVYIKLANGKIYGYLYGLIDKILKSGKKSNKIQKIQLNSIVKFNLKGKIVSGKILKLNKKTVIVKIDDKKWSIPHSLII